MYEQSHQETVAEEKGMLSNSGPDQVQHGADRPKRHEIGSRLG